MITASATGAAATIRPSSATGSLSSSIASARQNGRWPVASSTSRQSPRGARGTGGRWASSQPVGGAPLALRELPHEPRHGRQQRQPDPGDAEHGAEQQPAADHHEVGDAVGQPEQQVQQRAAGEAQVARQLEAAGRADRRHPRPSTSTSPVPLMAWTANGASSVSVRLRTSALPRELVASTR